MIFIKKYFQTKDDLMYLRTLQESIIKRTVTDVYQNNNESLGTSVDDFKHFISSSAKRKRNGRDEATRIVHSRKPPTEVVPIKRIKNIVVPTKSGCARTEPYVKKKPILSSLYDGYCRRFKAINEADVNTAKSLTCEKKDEKHAMRRAVTLQEDLPMFGWTNALKSDIFVSLFVIYYEIDTLNVISEWSWLSETF